MQMCRSVGALLLAVAFVVTLAFATIVMTVRAIDMLQQPLTSLDEDLFFGESLGECDPFTLAPCF